MNVKETITEEDLRSKLQIQEDGTEVSDVYELWESLLRNVKSFTGLSATHIGVVLPEAKSFDPEVAEEDSSNEDQSLFSGISFEEEGKEITITKPHFLPQGKQKEKLKKRLMNQPKSK